MSIATNFLTTNGANGRTTIDLNKILRKYIDVNAENPSVIVVFGASGDLAKKEIFPALWCLFRSGLLPKSFLIIGYGRSSMRPTELKRSFKQYCEIDDEEKEKFEQFEHNVGYVQGAYDQPEGFTRLCFTTFAIFGLPLPSMVFEAVTLKIKTNFMREGHGWVRIIIEKPFGKDVESCKELFNHLSTNFNEEQIYFPDHYMGKTMIQSIITLRFANPIQNLNVDNSNIASVLITCKESSVMYGGVGNYKTAGIISDVMPLMQVLTLLAMKKPVSLQANHIRDEKVKVLQAMKSIELKEIVVGKCITLSNSNQSRAVKRFKADPDVPEDSTSATYALAVFHIQNEQWEGVPFIMRCGKALDENKAEVRITFKDVNGDILSEGRQKRTELVLQVRPGELLSVNLMINKQGMRSDGEESNLVLTFNQKAENEHRANVYTRLIADVLKGEMSSFFRADELEQVWRLIAPLLQKIEEKKPSEYLVGSCGPKEATQLLHLYGYDNN